MGAGYRYSILRDIEYKITFIVIIFESIVSSSSRFMPLVITYDVLFQGPKVTNYTQRRNICIRWAIDMILCDGDNVRKSIFTAVFISMCALCLIGC